jgi:hypothetical protein
MLNNQFAADLDPSLVDLFIRNMPGELVNKPVMLSNGEIGAIHAVDADDIEYPYVRAGGEVIKTNKHLFCAYMYYEE